MRDRVGGMRNSVGTSIASSIAISASAMMNRDSSPSSDTGTGTICLG